MMKFLRRDGWFCLSIPRGARFFLAGVVLSITTLFFALLFSLWQYHHQDAIPFPKAAHSSAMVLDRHGQLLRAFTTSQGRWRLPVTLKNVDPVYIKMLLAYEDKRFYSHHGVDPLALGRAGLQLAWHRRIISGGSTLTMQVARLLEPRKKRTFAAKFKQMLRAIQLENTLSKQQILELYLNLAPMGGNLEGVRAASLAYFNREPKRLTLAQAAQLVAIPQSPEYRRPDHHPQYTLKSRNVVLKRVASLADFLTPQEAKEAMVETMPTSRVPFPKYAPHLTQSEVLRFPKKKIHTLTLDKKLQRKMERLVSAHARRFSKQHSIAMIVAENKSGTIRAQIGAPDFLKKQGSSHIDMTRAWRSPGSTLKPFIYGMGFEDGLIHPQTLIRDEATSFGLYKPKNFDGGFNGTVTISKALQASLNIPAVKVMDKVGAARLFARLTGAGGQIKLPKGAKPNISMALGGLGMRLRDLATLYMGLARGGNTVPLNWRQRNKFDLSKPIEQKRLLSPSASWYISSILQNVTGNNNKTPFAYKTGTSYGYRDAWVVGYNGKYTIAIWVGRPDGSASPGMTGRSAAVPILFDAFKRLGTKQPLSTQRPQNILSAKTARLPLPLQHFEQEQQKPGLAQNQVKITFPLAQTKLALKQAITPNGQVQSFDDMMIKAKGGSFPLTWTINGAPVSQSHRRRTTFWKPDEEGFVRLGVIDANGQSDSIMVRVQ